MATISNPLEKTDEEKAKEASLAPGAPISSAPSSGAPGTPPSPVGAPAGPKPTASRFVNLNRYIDANKGAAEKTAGVVAEKVGAEAKDVASGIQKAAEAQKTAAATAAASTQTEATQLGQKLASNAALESAEADKIGSLLDIQGKIGTGLDTQAVQAGTGFQQFAGNLSGLEGKYAALGKYFGSAPGRGRLTGAVMQQTAGAQQPLVSQATTAASDIGSTLSTEGSNVATAAEKANAEINAARDALRGVLGSEFSELNQNLTAAEARQEAENLANTNAVAAYNEREAQRYRDQMKAIDDPYMRQQNEARARLAQAEAALNAAKSVDSRMLMSDDGSPLAAAHANYLSEKQAMENAMLVSQQQRDAAAAKIRKADKKQVEHKNVSAQGLLGSAGMDRYSQLRRLLGDRSFLSPEQSAIMKRLG